MANFTQIKLSHCFVKAIPFSHEVEASIVLFSQGVGRHKEDSCSSVDSLATRISKQLNEVPFGEMEVFGDCHHLVYPEAQEYDAQEARELAVPPRKRNIMQYMGDKFRALGDLQARTKSSDSQSSDSLSWGHSSSSGTRDAPNSGAFKMRRFRLFGRRKNSEETNCMLCELGDMSGQIEISMKVADIEGHCDEISMKETDVDGFTLLEYAPIESEGFSLHIPYNSVQKGKMIGNGAFGEVYEGQWHGKMVAMKEVASHHYTYSTGATFIDSLKKEITVLKVSFTFAVCWTSPNI